MTAFGGIFRGPKIEGVEESDHNGQRGRVVGLDLDSGVVRVQVARPGASDSPPSPEASSDEAWPTVLHGLADDRG